MNTLDTLTRALQHFLHQEFKLQPSIDITLNTDSAKQQFGDLSTNAALILAKQLGSNPRAVAQTIIEKFSHPSLAKIEIAGPGFVNMHLTQQAVCEVSRELLDQGADFYKGAQTDAKKYNIEFVSANPTGPLHFGHGRGGIIGDVLGNTLRLVGHQVTKEFYINDAGVQIQKLGESFKARCLQAAGITIELPEDGYQGTYLVDLAKQCIDSHGMAILNEDDRFFAQYAQDNMLEALRITLQNYGIIYDVWFSELLLHIKHGEKSAIDHALSILESRGHLFTHEEALWFRSTTFGDDKDRVVKKNTGHMTYVAADIAYLENKLDRGFDQLIMVLGQDHHSYVTRLKAVMQGLGRNPDQLDIILYQLVTLKESGEMVRMSKRAGRMVTLQDIIDEVGTDVARFFYLNKKADAHLEFDVELALKQTDENPVYYVQYAYVRIASILQKAFAHTELQNITQVDTAFISDAEKLLIKKMAHLKHILQAIARNYQTHALTYYVIELAQLFHSYYNMHKVVDLDSIEQSRGRLCTMLLLKQTFGICFKILGISAPEKM